MGYSFESICKNTLPIGKYKVEVSEIAFKMNAEGKVTKDLNVRYTILEGAYAKRTLMDTISEVTFDWRLGNFLKACGADLAREFSTPEEMWKYGIKQAKGKVIMIDVTVKTYQGREYNNITKWEPLAGSTTSADDVAKALGVTPEVKGTPLDDVLNADEGTNMEAPLDDTSDSETDEPNLDVDMDSDIPF